MVFVFDGGRVSTPLVLNDRYDVSPDGRRFVVVQQVAEGAQAAQARPVITLVQNWARAFEP